MLSSRQSEYVSGVGGLHTNTVFLKKQTDNKTVDEPEFAQYMEEGTLSESKLPVQKQEQQETEMKKKTSRKRPSTYKKRSAPAKRAKKTSVRVKKHRKKVGGKKSLKKSVRKHRRVGLNDRF